MIALAGAAFVMVGVALFKRSRSTREQPTVIIAATATLANHATVHSITYRPTNLVAAMARDPVPFSPYLLPVEEGLELGNIPVVTAIAYFEGTEEDRLVPY